MRADFKRVLVLALLTAATPGLVWGQSAPPATDIYLADVGKEAGSMSFGPLQNLTNRADYDNQPSFLPGGEAILYTAFQAGGQTDIILYDLSTRTSRNLTKTPQSEYSPTITPDGRFFSVIRVESDGKQRLWKFPLQGGEPSLVLPDTQPVGYQVWAGSDAVALFILGDPPTLQLVGVPGGASRVLDERIGRSLHMVPGERSISYVRKGSADEWWIRRLDLQTNQSVRLTRTLQGSEDFVWTPWGSLLMGKGSKLFLFHPGQDSEWREAADLSEHSIDAISRLAISPGGSRLAIVARH